MKAHFVSNEAPKAKLFKLSAFFLFFFSPFCTRFIFIDLMLLMHTHLRDATSNPSIFHCIPLYSNFVLWLVAERLLPLLRLVGQFSSFSMERTLPSGRVMENFFYLFICCCCCCCFLFLHLVVTAFSTYYLSIQSFGFFFSDNIPMFIRFENGVSK